MKLKKPKKGTKETKKDLCRMLSTDWMSICVYCSLRRLLNFCLLLVGLEGHFLKQAQFVPCNAKTVKHLLFSFICARLLTAYCLLLVLPTYVCLCEGSITVK
jgi:hypothetical protein